MIILAVYNGKMMARDTTEQYRRIIMEEQSSYRKVIALSRDFSREKMMSTNLAVYSIHME